MEDDSRNRIIKFESVEENDVLEHHVADRSGEVIFSHFNKDRRYHSFFAFLAFFSACYYNLTPFLSIDCWWHMRFAEYFLKNGKPVIYDPFAIQNGKILATYPDILPGIMFLFTFDHFSYLGLNLLRVALFSLFIGVLCYIGRKRWNGYSILLQLIILAVSMRAKVILQPDLFNYLLFPIWILLLDEIARKGQASIRGFMGLAVVEMVWANTHTLFFYYGLPIGILYLCGGMMSNHKAMRRSMAHTGSDQISLWVCLVSILTLWLVNPLGPLAFQSFVLHLMDTGLQIDINRSSLEALGIVDTYGYMLIPVLFLIEKPWRFQVPGYVWVIRLTVIGTLIFPAVLYERSLPFLPIFLIVIQGTEPIEHFSSQFTRSRVFMAVVLLLSMLLIVERNFLLIPPFIEKLGLRQYYSYHKGIGLDSIHPYEYIREVTILNQLAAPGNCFTNCLGISSVAVWHCPDKPFFLYGHGGVIRVRSQEFKTFLTNLVVVEDSERFMDKYRIRTLIIENDSAFIIRNYHILSTYLQLVYIDHDLSIFVKRGSMTEEQRRRVTEFYAGYRPDIEGPQLFSMSQRIFLYAYLWFSAEMTGNDGSYYLSIAEKYYPPDVLEKLKKELMPLIEKNSAFSNQAIGDLES